MSKKTFQSPQPWYLDKDIANANLFGLLSGIQHLQASRRTSYIRYAGLYGDQDLWTLMSAGMFGVRPYENRFNRLNFNVSQSMVDTVVSKHAASQPRIEVLTEGGNWEQQMRAKATTKFIQGEFERLRLYREAPLALRNALIFGDGYLQFYVRDGKICCDVAFPGDFDVDDIEALDGKPRQLFRTKYVAREMLAAEFPDNADAIMQATCDDLIPQVGTNLADMVKVVEAWHLPSSEDAGDGRHAIVISSDVLLWEDWNYDCYPFVRCRWRPAMRGYYSQGLVDQLMGLQVEINRIAKRIGLGIHLMGVPYYLVEDGSEVVPEHLSNEIGHIVKYSGVKPEPVTNPVFSPEVYQYLENLYNKAYALAGISPLEAQARKPAGLNSEPSMREYADLASERHAFFSMEWQEFFKECAWQVLRCARELKDGGIDVVSPQAAKHIMQPVKFSDCLVDDDDFIFRVQVGSLLPTTTAGKINTVNDMANSGLLTPGQALKLLNYPDLEPVIGKITAQEDFLDKEIYAMLKEGEPRTPEPMFLDLQTAVQRVNEAYLQAMCDGAPEDRLELLRQWIRDAYQAMQPPPPPPGAMPPVDPGMAPPPTNAIPQPPAPPPPVA
jgi:hypothetical protein